MSISLKRIVEQTGADGQFYDLGKDFSNFRRSIDGTFDQIKQKFEQSIGAQLNGKRVRARASRGYKQYVKDYEFDVSKITLDDYYDNYVVVAHDNTTPKSKEYFLKPGFKIQILGQASGQPSQGVQTSTEKPEVPLPSPSQPKEQPAAAAATVPVKEEGEKKSEKGYYDAYPVSAIADDIKGWMPNILVKREGSIRDYIKGLGWLRNMGKGKSVAMFDLKIPLKGVKIPLNPSNLQRLLSSANKQGTIDTTYELVKSDAGQYDLFVRVKKTMIDRSAI